MTLELKIHGTFNECIDFYNKIISNKDTVSDNMQEVARLKERIDGLNELHSREIVNIQKQHFQETAALREEIGRLKNPEAYEEIDKCQK